MLKCNSMHRQMNKMDIRLTVAAVDFSCMLGDLTYKIQTNKNELQ